MHLRWQNFLKMKFQPNMFRKKLCLSVTESIIIFKHIFVCVICPDDIRIKLNIKICFVLFSSKMKFDNKF